MRETVRLIDNSRGGGRGGIQQQNPRMPSEGGTMYVCHKFEDAGKFLGVVIIPAALLLPPRRL